MVLRATSDRRSPWWREVLVKWRWEANLHADGEASLDKVGSGLRLTTNPEENSQNEDEVLVRWSLGKQGWRSLG